jgi:hypothetical protein
MSCLAMRSALAVLRLRSQRTSTRIGMRLLKEEQLQAAVLDLGLPGRGGPRVTCNGGGPIVMRPPVFNSRYT